MYFLSQHCFSAEQLVRIYSLGDNKSASAGLSRSDVARLSPALVEQILSGACADVTEPVKQDGLSTAESKSALSMTRNWTLDWMH